MNSVTLTVYINEDTTVTFDVMSLGNNGTQYILESSVCEYFLNRDVTGKYIYILDTVQNVLFENELGRIFGGEGYVVESFIK